MASDSETCRLNGKKSRGPISEKGKANASRNATKHGLLAKLPPLLASEDLVMFQGIVQGLVDDYEPQTVTEHFLVQQVAMAMLKQYRLWTVEVAIATTSTLEIQRKLKHNPNSPNPVDEILKNKSSRHSNVLEAEQSVLTSLRSDIKGWAMALPKKNTKAWAASSQAEIAKRELLDLLESARHDFPPEVVSDDACNKAWKSLIAAQVGIEVCCDMRIGDIKNRIENIVIGCTERIDEISLTLADIEQLNQEIESAKTLSVGIPLDKTELLSRYERHLNRSLYDALDKLQQMKEHRQAVIPSVRLVE